MQPERHHVLSSYVPGLLNRAAIEDARLAGLRDPGRPVKAAALFVDLSGFTALTERLARSGPEGAERLSAILNAYFDPLFDRIGDRGGDVVKLAGDALVALWESDETHLGHAVREASACVLSIQADLSGKPEILPGIRLTARAGIGAGEILLRAVGGVRNRWELLVAGDPLAQIGEAEHHAEPGDVVLSPEALELVADVARGTPLDGGYFRLSGIPGADRPFVRHHYHRDDFDETCLQTLGGFVPASIRRRLAEGDPRWLSELRAISPIFVNFPGLGEGDAEAPGRIFRTFQEVVYRFEGSVNKLSVDDKGITLIAAMGLPPLAHDDDPARAARAAMALDTAFREMGVTCSVGVTTGRVYCGEIGSPLRREYTMIGDVMNLAARLMMSAPPYGGVLCDHATARAAGQVLTFRPLEPIRLKGKADPVPIFIPSPEPPQSRRGSVARAEERNRLMVALADLRDYGRGGAILIVGEPGLGKSQLVSDLLHSPEARDVAPFLGGSDPIESGIPYHAWRPVLEQLLGLDGASLGEERRERVRRYFDGRPELGRLAPLLNGTMPLDLPENEHTRALQGDARAGSTQELLVELLGSAATCTPTLIVLEDTHWFDSASWALAEALIKRESPVLLVLTSRPPAPEDGPSWFDVLNLPPFGRDDTLALVRLRLDAETVEPGLVDLIDAKAQGNPFYVEELTYALRESGLLVLESGHARLADDLDRSSVSLPDSLQGVVLSRIDRLDPPEQDLLKVASVIGRNFGVRVLRDVHPEDQEKPRLPERLDRLTQLELTERDEPEPNLSYLFRHVITRDVAYELMLFAQRRVLHREVADWYERAHAADPGPWHAILAHHWSRSDRPGKAIAHFASAAQRALRNGNYREAAQGFRDAWQLHDRLALEEPSLAAEPLTLAHWERQLGAALLSLGQLAEGAHHVDRALVHLGKPPARGLVALVGSDLAAIARQAAHRFSRRAPGLPSPPGDAIDPDREASACFSLVAYHAYLTQSFHVATNAAIRSLNLAERGMARNGVTTELVKGYAAMAVAAGLGRIDRLAEHYAGLALDAAGLVQDQSARTYAYLLAGIYSLGMARWPEAESRLTRATDLAREIGDWRLWEEAQGEIARYYHIRGEYGRSLEMFREQEEFAEQRGHQQVRGWGFRGQAKNLIRLGRSSEALELLDASIHLPGEPPVGADAILAHGVRALALLYLRRFDEARASAEEALRWIVGSKPMVSYGFEGYAGTAVTLLYIRRRVVRPGTPEARMIRGLSDRALSGLRRFARIFPLGRPRLEILLGWSAALDGRPRRASRLLNSGLARAQRLGMPVEIGTAHVVLSSLAPPDSPEAERHRAAARAAGWQSGSIFEE